MEAAGAISAAVSLLDVAARSSNAICDLISNWRNVPIEIIALGNEVSDSKAVLNQTCYLLHRLRDAPSRQTPNPVYFPVRSIEQQIHRALPVWAELQDLLAQFDQDGEDGGTRCSKARRFRWLKCRKKADQMKRSLRERRMGIMELVISSSA
jgi:hypothetical protein